METVVGEQSGKSSFPWASEGRKEGASVRRCLAEARWGAGVGSGANTGARRGRALVNRWQEGERSSSATNALPAMWKPPVRRKKNDEMRWPRGNFPEKISPPHDSLDYTLWWFLDSGRRGEEIAGKVSIRRKFLPFFDNQGEIELGNLIRSSTLSVLSKTLSASTEDGVGIWYVFFYSEKLVTRRIWKNE